MTPKSVSHAAWIFVPLLFACQGIIDAPATIPPDGVGVGGTSSTGGSASGGTGGSVTGGTTGSGTGGTGTGGAGSGGAGTGGAGTGGSAAGGTGATGTGPLCDVLALMRRKCTSCHSNPPSLKTVPMSLVSYEDLVAPSGNDPTLTIAEMSIVRMQDTMAPMPPAPASPATASDVAIVQAWIDAGMPSTCDQGTAGSGGSGGSGGDGTVVGNPYDTPVVCTSNKRWTGGNQESASMHPGVACINCHTSGEGEGPRFTFAGTVYPTAHEPDDCNGLNGSADGTQVIITDATGATFTMTPNSVGNFSYTARGAAVTMPYTAKVVRAGNERVMTTKQQTGDCNACHTEAGTKDAPGRIMAP